MFSVRRVNRTEETRPHDCSRSGDRPEAPLSSWLLLVVLACLAMLMSLPASAQSDSDKEAGSEYEESHDEANELDGEDDDAASQGGGATHIGAKIFDVIAVRPPSACKWVVGIPFYIVSAPFVGISGGASEAWDFFVVEPFQYTFTRPLGDL